MSVSDHTDKRVTVQHAVLELSIMLPKYIPNQTPQSKKKKTMIISSLKVPARARFGRLVNTYQMQELTRIQDLMLIMFLLRVLKSEFFVSDIVDSSSLSFDSVSLEVCDRL